MTGGIGSLPPEPAGLVGRAAELETILDRLNGLEAGTPAVAIVSGDAGIGKSRFLAEVDRRAAGHRTLAAAGSAIGGLRPFALVADALRSDAVLRPTFDETVARALAGGASELEVIDGIVSLVEEAAAGGPILVLLDDLHRTDPSTALTLRHLVHRVPDLPVGLVVALRTGTSNRHAAVFVDEACSRGALQVQLPPLDEAMVADMAADVLGAPPGPVLLDALDRAAGNPLYVMECLAALDAGGALADTGTYRELVGDPLPGSLRETVLQTLRPLPAETIELLELAAVIGSEFTTRDLASVSGRGAGVLYEQLQPALRRGIVVDTGAAMAFAHGIVEESLYQQVPESVRRTLHHDIGLALARTAQGRSRAAHHLLRGASDGDDETADELLTIAEGAVSLDTEADLRSAAFGVMSARHPARVETLRRTIACLGMTGRLDEARALAEAHLPGADPSLARAIHLGLVRASSDASEHVSALEAVEAVRMVGGLEAAEDAELTAFEATSLVWSGDPERGARVAATVVDREDAPPLATVLAEQMLSTTALLAGDAQAAVERARRAVSVERAHGTETASGIYLGMALMGTEALDEASTAFDEVHERSLDRAHASGAVYAGLSAALCHLLAGRLDVAELRAESGLAQARATGNGDGVLVGHAVLARVALHEGELERARDEVGQGEIAMATLGPGVDWFCWARALVLTETGDAEQAYRELAAAWEMLAAHRYLGSYQALAPDLVRMAMAHRDHAFASSVAAEVALGAQRSGSLSAVAAAEHCAGLVAEDAQRLADAAEHDERARRPLAAAAARVDAAAVLPDAAAKDLLRRARDAFAAAGAAGDAARVDALLRTRGLGARHRTPRPVAGWESLTAAERRVVPLVASGMTSKMIAGELYVSVFTVDTHLRHIYRKLGIRSRAQLATAWAAHTATLHR